MQAPWQGGWNSPRKFSMALPLPRRMHQLRRPNRGFTLGRCPLALRARADDDPQDLESTIANSTMTLLAIGANPYWLKGLGGTRSVGR
jgi:hypothetical protein